MILFCWILGSFTCGLLWGAIFALLIARKHYGEREAWRQHIAAHVESQRDFWRSRWVDIAKRPDEQNQDADHWPV